LTFLCFWFEQPAAAQWIGLSWLAISFAVCWATVRESRNAKLLAAFDEKLPHGLLRTGPYAVVRHPFYTSYLIQWIGWAIAAWTIWALVPVVMMVTIYTVAARDEEAKFARTDMADEYAEYMKTTGRFFPRFFR
jgi:protein-S-isoprenylcysteine O-methyltransferase Ste14